MNKHIYKPLLAVALIAMLFTLGVGPLQRASASGGATATVNTGALNIRSGPGISYGVVTSVYRGTVLTLLARNADTSWVKVALWNGTQGWVNSRYIATAYPLYSLPVEGAPQPQPQPVPGGAVATVNTGALHVRSGPGINYGVVFSVYRGTTMTLLARNYYTTWVKVALSNGVQGWVNASYIATTYPLYSLPVEGGAPQPQPLPQPVPGYRTHIVQPGENLFRISLRYGVNMYTLAALNGIYDISRIYAGQVLLIP